MKISTSWISDYLDLSGISAEQLEDLITTRIAEVDNTHHAALAVDSALVAEVVSVKAHPKKENLKVALVNIGNEKIEVICGAQNCKEKLLTAYIPVGKNVYSPSSGDLIEVSNKEIAGVLSRGILVSEAELGISTNHEGIIELTPEFISKSKLNNSETSNPNPGDSLSEHIGGSEVIFEIDNKSLTHRPDLWSHYGFAREIAAVLKRPLKFSLDAALENYEKYLLSKSESNYRIEIEKNCGCRRFTLTEIHGVQATQSPLWLRRRLFSIGAGVRNLLVDLSNYVMHDTGQPNHAYDADLLKGKVFNIRKAKTGEKIVALDDNQYELDENDITITNNDQPIAIGGVIGGKEASIQESTTKVILESANFDPVTIRLTTKRHALRTDASNRFEKSLSSSSVLLGQLRFYELLKLVIPQAKIVGSVLDNFPEKPKEVEIKVSCDYIRSRLGEDLSDTQILEILSSLGLTHRGDGRFLVPHYRATRDLSIEDDLVEEVGRIHGYENISECSPKIDSRATRPRPVADFETKAKEVLLGMGFSEVYLYSFMNESLTEKLGINTENALRVQNPVDTNMPLIRTTLVPGLIETIEHNIKHFHNFGIFEFGRAYTKQNNHTDDQLKKKDRIVKNEPTHEARLLGIAFVGERNEKNNGDYFYFINSVVKRLASILGIRELEVCPVEDNYHRWMHPGRSAEIRIDNIKIGYISEVSPGVLEADVCRAVIAEIDTEMLVGRQKQTKYAPVPKFPNSFFELSVVLPKRENYKNLDIMLRKIVPSEVLRSIEVLSVYTGQPLKETEKSISVKLNLGRNDRTINSEELSEIQSSIINSIRNSNYTLRG